MGTSSSKKKQARASKDPEPAKDVGKEDSQCTELEFGGAFLQAYNDTFKAFDIDGSGLISAEELRDLMNKLKPDDNMTLEEAKQLIAEVDSDGDGTLNFNEFVAFMNRPEPEPFSPRPKPQPAEAATDADSAAPMPSRAQSVGRRFSADTMPKPVQVFLKAYEKAFKAFDVNGNGLISAEELRDLMNKLKPDDNMTLEEAKGLVAKTDSDGDGTLNFNEFVELMNRQEPELAAVSPSSAEPAEAATDADNDASLPPPVPPQTEASSQMADPVSKDAATTGGTGDKATEAQEAATSAAEEPAENEPAEAAAPAAEAKPSE